MNNENKNSFGDTEMGAALGLGICSSLIILALCLGIGGCCHLAGLNIDNVPSASQTTATNK